MAKTSIARSSVHIQFVIVQDFDVAAVDVAGRCGDDHCCGEVPANVF